MFFSVVRLLLRFLILRELDFPVSCSPPRMIRRCPVAAVLGQLLTDACRSFFRVHVFPRSFLSVLGCWILCRNCRNGFLLAGIGGGVRFGGSSKVKLGFCFARFFLSLLLYGFLTSSASVSCSDSCSMSSSLLCVYSGVSVSSLLGSGLCVGVGQRLS